MSKDKYFDELLEKIKQTHALKEQDYTGDREPDFNFNFSQEFASQFTSRIDKPYAYLIGTKIARLVILLNQEIARPRNEPIEDTFQDIATYFLLWASKRKKMVVQEQRKNQPLTCDLTWRPTTVLDGSTVKCVRPLGHDGLHESKEGFKLQVANKAIINIAEPDVPDDEF